MAEQEVPAPLKSLNSYDPTFISFVNKSSRNAKAWWLNFSGKPVSYGDIKPGKALKMNTYLSEYRRTSNLFRFGSPLCTKASIFFFTAHPWIFRASDGAKLLVNHSEVYFPTQAQYEDGYPLYQSVCVTAPGASSSFIL